MQGHYTPSPPQDVWALGLAMAGAVKAQLPLHQILLRQTPEYQTGVKRGVRTLAHLQHTAGLATEPVPYAEQVCWLGARQAEWPSKFSY